MKAASARALVEAGEAIRDAALDQFQVSHPEQPGFNKIEFVMFTDEPEGPNGGYRNATLMPPGRIDRSPCGTGTSARMAQWAARGDLKVGDDFIHESIIGSLFNGRVEAAATVGDKSAIIPSIEG